MKLVNTIGNKRTKKAEQLCGTVYFACARCMSGKIVWVRGVSAALSVAYAHSDCIIHHIDSAI